MNSGLTQRREYVDIADIKRRVENNEIDLVPSVTRLGFPKEEEDRIDVVERDGGKEKKKEMGNVEFGMTGVPIEIAKNTIRSMSYGRLNWNCTVDMQVETEVGQYTSTWGDLKEKISIYVVIDGRQ